MCLNRSRGINLEEREEDAVEIMLLLPRTVSHGGVMLE